jgi:hypothetical protein
MLPPLLSFPHSRLASIAANSAMLPMHQIGLHTPRAFLCLHLSLSTSAVLLPETTSQPLSETALRSEIGYPGFTLSSSIDCDRDEDCDGLCRAYAPMIPQIAVRLNTVQRVLALQ